MEDSAPPRCLIQSSAPCSRILALDTVSEPREIRKVLVEESYCYMLPPEYSSIDNDDIAELLKAPIDKRTRALLDSTQSSSSLYPKGCRPCVVKAIDVRKREMTVFPFATYNHQSDFSELHRPDVREVSVPVYPFRPKNYDGIHVHTTPELHPGGPSSDEEVVQYVRTRAIRVQGLFLQPYMVQDEDRSWHRVRFDESELEKLVAHSEAAEANVQDILSNVDQSSRIARSLAESRRRSRDAVSFATQCPKGNFGAFNNMARKTSVVGRQVKTSDRYSMGPAVPEEEENDNWRASKRLRVNGDDGLSLGSGTDKASWRKLSARGAKGTDDWTTVSHAKKPKAGSGRVSLLSSVRFGSRS